MKDILVVVFVTVAIVAASVFACDRFLRYQCSNYAAATGAESRYMTLDACYVKTSGRWMRWDEYKAWVIAQSTSE